MKYGVGTQKFGHKGLFKTRVSPVPLCDAAYAAALNVLAVARQHLGSLDEISRIVRLGVYIAVVGDRSDLVKIADSARISSETFSEKTGCRRGSCSEWRACGSDYLSS